MMRLTFFREHIKQLKQKNFFLFALFIVLVIGNGCAQSTGIQNRYTPWKFAIISDTQGENRGEAGHPCINEPVVRAIALDIAVEHPDFVLVAGDLVNGWIWNKGTSFTAQYAKWKEAMSPVYDSGIRIYPIRGNHDVGPERAALPPLPAHLEPPPGALALLEKSFKNAFKESYIPRNGPGGEDGFTFSFRHKNAFIVGLDVYGNQQHKVDQDWLNQQLAGNINPHVFVYAHEPAFQIRHRDCLAFYLEDRDAFWDSLGKAGSRVYFCGHDHLYNRAVIADSAGNQIRQIIVGTGGGRLIQWSGTYGENTRVKGEYSNSGYHGYVLVTVDGLRATVVWKALVTREKENTWSVLDSFSYTLP
jgi:hypothetical protein